MEHSLTDVEAIKTATKSIGATSGEAKLARSALREAKPADKPVPGEACSSSLIPVISPGTAGGTRQTSSLETSQPPPSGHELEPFPPARSRKQVCFQTSPIVLGAARTTPRNHCLHGDCGRSLEGCQREQSFFPSSPDSFPISQERTYDTATHLSTATHEQRAKCGCHGITVQVNSGPLGLSLEGSYGIDGLMLKQSWSDCEGENYRGRYSVHVQQLKDQVACDTDRSDTARKDGRAESSGLIRVSRVGVECGRPPSSGTRTSPAYAYPRNSDGIWAPPSPACLGGNEEEHADLVPAGMLAIEVGDILVRIDRDQARQNVQKTNSAGILIRMTACASAAMDHSFSVLRMLEVSKRKFGDVVDLLMQAKRPTRLTFVRHACGRRFRDREGAIRRASPRDRLTRGARNKAGGGLGCTTLISPTVQEALCALTPRSKRLKKKCQPVETEVDGCPVAALIRARRSLLHCGMEEWYSVTTTRRSFWLGLIEDIPPTGEDDWEKVRRIVNSSQSLKERKLQGPIASLSRRKLLRKYARLTEGGRMDRVKYCGQEDSLASRVWKDVVTAMTPRRPSRVLTGGDPFGSPDTPGDERLACSVVFPERLWDTLFRVVYATSMALGFVAGISHMAAIILVQTSNEAMAYATLVSLLRDRMMRTLYRAGDVDVLDAYHLSGGRVVSYRPGTAEGDIQRRNDQVLPDGRHPWSEHEDLHPDTARASEQLGVRHLDVIGGLLPNRFVLIEPQETQQVVVGEMLPHLVQVFGRALRHRVPALYKHLCMQEIPISFLCAEWFTTAYLRNTPLPLAFCALDLFLARVDNFMIRLGLAIMEVLEPSLKVLSARDILLQYRGLVANASYKDVLRRLVIIQVDKEALATQAPDDFFPFGVSRDTAPCSVS